MSKQAVLQKFPQVDHHQATGELASVYEDIHSTLRVPWVAFGIRVMSQFEHFVPAAWAALKPQISTRYAEAGADKVREASIIPGPAPADPTPKLLQAGWTSADIAELKLALDLLNYGNPKYLNLISAWNEAWHQRDAGGRTNKPLSGTQAELLPYGLPEGIEKFHLLDPDECDDRTQRVLRDIRDASLHHGPASDYRVLAKWPDYLEIAYEEALKPVAITAEYDHTSWKIRKIAREHIRGFAKPGGVAWRDLTEKLSPEQIAGLTGLLFMYNRFIADITIAIIRLKQAFDGEKDATENKFPV
ncbi:halocarboxylic acid dehydrogenase DehI family protein [Paraburkholderia sp.]|uniref:halocarboxylic acid dehydrogenase DehI family protein n=1 Tax=Paraburkholderia sp. TaxID=1926495 RepID=UPI002F40E482